MLHVVHKFYSCYLSSIRLKSMKHSVVNKLLTVRKIKNKNGYRIYRNQIVSNRFQMCFNNLYVCVY